jgi:hypothetical protein
MMIYIWHKEQVITGTWSYSEIRHRYNYHFMYDPADDHPWGQASHGVWLPKEPEEVPKELLAGMTLMEVPT